jgi:DNA polymerase-3 subunit delta
MSEPSPVLISILTGEEQLLVREAEDRLTLAALGAPPNSFNFTAGSAAEDRGDTINLARTRAMMSRRRVVVLRDIDKADVDLLDALIAYAEHPNPDTTLILTGLKMPPPVGGKDRGRVLANLVKKIGDVRRFDAKDASPVPFAQAEAKRGGCTMDARAAELLVSLTGPELLGLRQEVNKLCTFMGGAGAITVEEVDLLCSLVADARLWGLTDAIVARDLDAAIDALGHVFADGGDGEAHRLLSQVAWKLRELLEIQSYLRMNPRPAAAPAAWAREAPQRRRRVEELLTKRPLDPVKTMAALARTNRRFHRSGPSAQHIFEGFVIDLLSNT